MTWQEKALCAQPGTNPDDWFPEPGNREALTAAKATCRRCPVAHQCLTYALTHENGLDTIHGVYGGTTAYARQTAHRRTA